MAKKAVKTENEQALPKKTFAEITAELTEAIEKLIEQKITALKIDKRGLPYLYAKGPKGIDVRQWLSDNYPNIKIIPLDDRFALWRYHGDDHRAT